MFKYANLYKKTDQSVNYFQIEFNNKNLNSTDKKLNIDKIVNWQRRDGRKSKMYHTKDGYIYEVWI